MARKKMMRWEGSPAYRWRKMYRGEMFRVSCADLGLPESDWTEEASREAATQWWESKLAEIIGKGKRKVPTPLDAEYRDQWRQKHEEPDDEEQRLAKIVGMARRQGITIPETVDPYIVRYLFGNQRIWEDRFDRDAKPAPTNFRLDHHAELFLDMVKGKVRPKSAREIRLVDHFSGNGHPDQRRRRADHR